MRMKANKSEWESVSDIMKRVSHADLLSHYLGINSLPVLINSPLRKDTHPSFFIYSPDGERVLYKDYATGDYGDIYSLLQNKDNISFSELLHKISLEKSFQKSESNLLSNTSPIKRYTKSSRELRVKTREWRKFDIEYWQQYGISLEWLKFAGVYPISHKIIYKDGHRNVFHAAKYAYVFVEKKEGKVSLKVYQPLVEDKRRKWDNSNDASVVGLWTKIPNRGEKLVICSSLKDALCLWANTGIPAIYVQSETSKMSMTAQLILKHCYKHVFICFDNDAPGLKDGQSFAATTGFKNIVLPSFPEGKDISDLFKARGKEEFIKIIKPLFDI